MRVSVKLPLAKSQKIPLARLVWQYKKRVRELSCVKRERERERQGKQESSKAVVNHIYCVTIVEIKF